MKLFMLVLSLSLSGTLIGLLITVLRPLTRKYFSAKWNYYIWLLVVVRLVFPFHFDSAFHTDIQLTGLRDANISLQYPDSSTNTASANTDSGSAHSDSQYPDSSTNAASANTDSGSAHSDSQYPDSSTNAASADTDSGSAHSDSQYPDSSTHAISADAGRNIRQHPAITNPDSNTHAISADADSSTHKIAPSADGENSLTLSEADHAPAPDRTAASDRNTMLWKLLNAAAFVWFFVAALLLLLKLAAYYRFKTAVKKNCVPITDKTVTDLKNNFCIRLHIQRSPALCESPAVSGPLTVGLRRPVIILPPSSTGERTLPQFQLILHHELIHVARKDLLYKWIYQLLLCLHWFNPLLRYIGRQIDCDCELSCDERILAHLTDTGRKMYGNVLLDTAERAVSCHKSTLATTLYTNKKDLKKRLTHIVHYQKIPRFRLALSVCTLMIALMFTACGTVWISQEGISAAENQQQRNTDSDESSTLLHFLDSLSSDDNFLDELMRFDSPKKSGDAWNAYDDDSLLAGNDIKENSVAYNYYGGNNLHASSYALYGTSTFLIANAEQDIDVQITTSFDSLTGKFKIIYIAPDQSIVTLNDTGSQSTQTITMKKGKNVLKMVGQGAKIQNLNIYSDLNPSQFESVYYSEAEANIYLAKDCLLSGEPFDKEKLLSGLHYWEPEENSELFRVMLAAGADFTADELVRFLIFSDEDLASQYLIEALKEGTIKPLTADTITKLMPHLNQEYYGELLMTVSMDEFYDVFAKNIYRLSDDQIESCLNYYLDNGGILTYSMYKDISYQLSDSLIETLDARLSENK